MLTSYSPNSAAPKIRSKFAPIISMEVPVQATLTGSADVRGEVTGKFEVTASLQMVESDKTLTTQLRGTLQSTGPGSAGRSSPDATAPVVGGRSSPGNAAQAGAGSHLLF